MQFGTRCVIPAGPPSDVVRSPLMYCKRVNESHTNFSHCVSFQREEYKKIVEEQYWTVHIMQYLRSMGSDNSELDPERYCERGLESYQSQERRNEIDTMRKLHRLMVIHEQARQSVLGTRDPEQIRLMATLQSERSLLRAQIRAALDQRDAQQALIKAGTENILSSMDIEEAGEVDKKRLLEEAGILEEQQVRTNDEENSPIQPQLEVENVDIQELTVAGTVPFASLFSEKSIFNLGERTTAPSSVAPHSQSSTYLLNSEHKDELGRKKVSSQRLDLFSTDVPPATASGSQTVHSVADFLRRARSERHVQLSANASRYTHVGMSDQTVMPLANFESVCSSGSTSITSNDLSCQTPSGLPKQHQFACHPPSGLPKQHRFA